MQALGISMAIHPTRGLYVAFRGDAAGAARLAYDNVTVTSYSTAWRAVGPSGFGGRNSLYTSIGLGPDGMPYVAMQCGQQGKVGRGGVGGWLPAKRSADGTASGLNVLLPVRQRLEAAAQPVTLHPAGPNG